MYALLADMEGKPWETFVASTASIVEKLGDMKQQASATIQAATTTVKEYMERARDKQVRPHDRA